MTPSLLGSAAEVLRPAAPDPTTSAFALSVARGLADSPRWLSCRYLYDAEGSALFEQITAQPEYYLTRVEAGLLAAHADEIRTLAGAPTLVELGAGSAAKTRLLLDAWTAGGRRARYLPVDISRSMLAETCAALRVEHPRLDVQGLAGTYEQVMPQLRALSPLTLLFLGSTIGNLNEEETDAFLSRLSASLSPGDHFLLGVDLVKDVRTLEAAYDDAAGVSAAFTRNLFARMNRELGTTVDVDAIEHVAWFNDRRDRIEIYARFTREATIALPALGRRFRIARGEMILTEISRKFRPADVVATTGRHGFAAVRTFVDPTHSFALLLFRRASPPPDEGRAVTRLLDATRARTLELMAPLDATTLTRQVAPIMSPLVWDLGHVATFEAQWVARACGRFAGGGGDGFGVYDAIAHPRATRGTLPLPEPRVAYEMLDVVRNATRAARETVTASDDPLLACDYVWAMLAQHEAQHTETMLQTTQLARVTYEPAWRAEPRPGPGRVEASELLIPAGPFVMGTDDRAVAYDNERPAHRRELPAYFIDAAPVTNARYAAFVAAGGYHRRELWTAAGWLWRCEERVTQPLGWERDDDGGWWEHAFGRRHPLALERPVVHVSWFEAAAYARWEGKRLPTEAEWEKAAAWDLESGVARRYPWGDAPPTAEHANLDQRTFAPAAVGAYPRGRSFFGVHQMLGDVWEWTASDFAPYPGFAAFPYPEYSAVHFGRGYKVLRGGSWATQPIAIRTTFRNWDLPQRRQIFAGLRCARDA